MKSTAIIALAATLVCGSAAAQTIVGQTTLTLQGARIVADAAIAYARTHEAPGAAVAVVDASGEPLYLERLDGTFPAGAMISIGKARTAVAFQRPTRGIEETINQGRVAMTTLPDTTTFVPLQGGVPLVVDHHIVGAIGCSGAASAQQDEEVAMAGAQAVQTARPADAVTYLPAERVTSAFAVGHSGETLVTEPGLTVNANRRDGPGGAELHVLDTDIFYVLEGSATVVTGGDITDRHELSPGEIRGTAITDGTSHHLGKGDVMVIPNGVPHWFKTVQTPFRYYVIKSATGLQ